MRRRDRQCNTCAAQKKTPPFAKRDKRRARPPGHPFHHHIIPSPTCCPIVLGGIHTTGLNFHVHLRLDCTIPFSHLTSVTRLASKGLGVDFFFPLYTLRGALCVVFRVLATATIEGESSRGQTRFLVPYLGFCSFVFFLWATRFGKGETAGERERGGEYA